MNINSISYKLTVYNRYDKHTAPNFKAKENNSDVFEPANKSLKQKFFDKLKKIVNYKQKIFNKLYYKVFPKKNTELQQTEVVTIKPSVVKTSSEKPAEIVKFPEPQFSFDIERLQDTLNHTKKLSADWIEDNQTDFDNLIKAISTIDGMEYAKIKSIADFNDLIDSKQGQANVVNMLISSPEFLKNAQEQYAKEKKAYVDSIMPYLYKRDKQLKIRAIEAIEKYGSWEHGDKLGLFLGKRDEDIVVPVVRAIAATGGPRQALLINAFIRNPRTEYKSVNTYIEILDAMAKIGDMKKIDKSAHKIITAPLQRLKHHENPEIAKKANETLKIIFNK